MHHIIPIITAQSGKEREGKGFSPDELKEAGLNAADARKLGIRVDRKRKSKHEENINTLKAHAAKAKTQAKPKPAAESTKKPKN
jgi:large subunit ribosomal protein L13e